MTTLNENVKAMIDAGVPEDEIGKYIQKYYSTQTQTSTPAPLGQPVRLPPGVEQPDALTPQEIAAGAVRYGVPVAAGIASGGSLTVPAIALQALIAGGSEVAARQIERINADLEIDSLYEDLKAGGITAGVDATIAGMTRGAGGLFRWIGGKLFMPSEIPVDVAVAQRVLGELPDEYMKQPGKLKKFLDWTGATSGKRPFSLTGGRINAEERRIINWLEGMARAGIGSSGKMARFDLRNERAVADLIERYIVMRGDEVTGPEFGKLVTRIVGDTGQVWRREGITEGALDMLDPAFPALGKGFAPGESVGEMFLPVKAYRRFLYKQFRDVLEQQQIMVDGTKLRKYFLDNAAIAEGLPKKTYDQLRTLGLVPPLKAPTATTRKVTNVKTSKVAQEKVDEMSDLTRTDLLTGKAKRKAETVEGTRASSTTGTSQTVRETQTVGGMTEAEVAQEWANMSATDVDDIIRTLNTKWKGTVKGEGDDAILRKMVKQIEPDFLNKISANPMLKELHDTADYYFRHEVKWTRNAAIEGLRKAITNNPEKVMNMLSGAGDPRIAYNKLRSLKSSLALSAKTPRVGEALSETLKKGGIPDADDALKAWWEESVLRPLRYNMVARHKVDEMFNADSFIKMLDKGKDIPEYYNEVFGGAEQVKRIRDLMVALKTTQAPIKDKNIFIQLAQAGAIGGMLGGTTTAIFSDDPAIEAGGKGAAIAGTAILLGPYMLSRLLTNARLTRELTEGVLEGPRSGKLALTLRKLAGMKMATEFHKDDQLSRSAIDYYTSMPGVESPTGQAFPFDAP